MTATEERARSIFMSALDRAPDEWAALLDVACGGDAELKARVGQLLHAHRAIGSIHGGGLNDRTLGGAMPDDAPGTQIGPYKLLEQIGEGGMGLVFVAEQERPVRRQVALKVIKPGMDTREVIARFEAERQALALFDHPHIARVLDAGATALGRPFFVMELVRGIPITDYCDRARLGVGERLKLFVQICQAVQHAHQKGVIHRDLKPSNVLVTEHDATPVAKVIDFGVAKAVGQRLTDKTVYTRFLRMVGSPLYMSPEQAGLSGLDIDTRADIYSLGVILYELLTGTTPFDADRLREAEFDEVRKIIQEEEPARPSSRLSTLGQAADTVSANRGSDPRRLCRLCQGELDWIVMRCLEKDRNRRYESAVALANDVERHLLDEPVQASPPSRWYRTRKFVRRNRRALVSAAALGVALMVAVGAVAGSIGWAMRDRAARESEADRELESALQSAASLRDRGNWVEAREVVKRAEWLLADGRHETEQQQIRAIVADLDMATRLEEIRLTDPGTGWLILSRAGVDAPYTEAFKAYGIDVAALDVPTAAERISASAIRALLVTALHDWMWAKFTIAKPGPGDHKAARHVQAWTEYQYLRSIAQRVVPLEWWQHIYDPDIQLDRRALEDLAGRTDVAEMPPYATVYLAHLLSFAQAGDKAVQLMQSVQQRWQGDFFLNYELAWHFPKTNPVQREQAIAYMRAAVALRPQHPSPHIRLGMMLEKVGRLDQAIASYRNAFELRPDDRLALGQLGNALESQGKREEAITLFVRQAAAKPEDGAAQHSLGSAYRRAGQWDKAIAAFRESSRLSPASHYYQADLGWLLATCPEPTLRDPAQAVDLGKKATQINGKLPLGWLVLGVASYRARDWDAAVAALEEWRRLTKDGNAAGWFFLGMAQWERGDREQARIWYRRAIEGMRDKKGVGSDPLRKEELERFRAEAESLIVESAKEQERTERLKRK